MTGRRRLPNRRLAITERLEVAGRAYIVTVGLRPGGEAAEVFITGPKDGSQLGAIVQDAALVISLALQSGVEIDALALSVARLPGDGLPASVIGAALDLIRRVDAEMAPAAPPADPSQPSAP